MLTRRTHLAAALALALALTGTACSSDGDQPERAPAEVLAAAKNNLDEAPGFHVLLSTEGLPDGISGIISADGDGNHDPAFKGNLKVAAAGITADAAVVAVDGVVYAKLPFTTDFAKVNPRDYGAPDPAALMSTDKGLSSLLTALEEPEAGDSLRDGETLLTEYTGILPGNVVAGVIPSAAAKEDFAATFTITEDDVLNEAEITGPFYPRVDDVTYTIKFSDFGSAPQIKAPQIKTP